MLWYFHCTQKNPICVKYLMCILHHPQVWKDFKTLSVMVCMAQKAPQSPGSMSLAIVVGHGIPYHPHSHPSRPGVCRQSIVEATESIPHCKYTTVHTEISSAAAVTHAKIEAWGGLDTGSGGTGLYGWGNGHLSALCAAICQLNSLSCIFRALHHTRFDFDWHVVERLCLFLSDLCCTS